MKRNPFLYAIYQPYKWLIYIPLLIINSLWISTMAFLTALLINEWVGSFIFGRLWAWLSVVLVPAKVEVSGRENIKTGQSYVIVANHQSLFDIFVIYWWLKLDIRWMMKKELRRLPGIGFASAQVGHIFIDRSDSRKAFMSLQQAREKLVNGISVVIFPEGTRSKTTKMLPFKRGAFKLASDLNLPVLPITIIGTRNIMPSETIDIFPAKVQMIIHKPIEFQRSKENEYHAILKECFDIIEKGKFS